jgi:sigma-B regulation protein RsbU (phosphoserine phosphatase)
LIARHIDSRFVTLVYGVLSADGCLRYANAGHNPPMLLSNGAVKRLDTGGTPLGAFEHASFHEEAVVVSHGDTLVMFSDGLTDACNSSGEDFGEERLASCLLANSAAPLAALLDQVFSAVKQFSGSTEPTDDMTLAVMRGSRD